MEFELEQALEMAHPERERREDGELTFFFSRISRAEELNSRARKLPVSKIFKYLIG